MRFFQNLLFPFVVFAVCWAGLVQSGTLGERSSGNRGDSVPVELFEARQEVLDGGLKFTVRYRPLVENLQISWRNDYVSLKLSEVTNRNLSDDPSGIQETSAVGHATERGDVTLGVGFHDPLSGVGVELFLYGRPYEAEDDIEKDLPIPIFEIEPEGDFVYERDADNITIKIRLPHNDITRTFPTFFSQQYIYSAKRGGLLNLLPPPIVYTAYIERTINTAYFGDISGIHEYTTSISPLHFSFVKTVSLFKTKVLRPSSQSSPFPSGFLEVVITPDFHKWNWLYGTHKKTCLVGHDCSLDCLAVGQDVKDIAVSKIRLDGSRDVKDISDLHLYSTGPYKRGILYPVTPDLSGPPVERYVCSAVNEQGVKAEQVYDIYFDFPADILEERSHIREIRPDTPTPTEGSTIITLELVCTAVGRPWPRITFDLDQPRLNTNFVKPDSVEEHGNTVIATKRLTFDTSDPYGSNGGHGALKRAGCIADNGVQAQGRRRRRPYYRFEVPDYFDLE